VGDDPCSQSRIGCDRHLQKCEAAQVEAASTSWYLLSGHTVLCHLLLAVLVNKLVSIRPRRIAVQELETGPLHRFQDWPNEQVPRRAAGVYTIWEGDRLLYVGMSGRAMTAEYLEVSDGGRIRAKGLWTRLNTHASGRRSGDQFCVYVGDRFVVPGLTASQKQQFAAGTLSLDTLIRALVHQRLSYRFVVCADGAEALKLEREVRRGSLSAGKPYLNPLG
jgi:hypothetical protein